MKHRFTAVVSQEDEWYVAQCLEVDVASQGESRDSAIANLREALESHFDEPRAESAPGI
ncbi:MAG: type II toxin-antitoxin system HicB family antitoxin [Chloroflexi bacterium]|nr:type II toxin-antitoxin system HicB family antitoxin [Chloroflexota bacterium]MDA1270961.1 type II toxin-antitoxin system HicB family antitoxin [Chloroflexota bacterium]PKB59011.1 MAG: HicB family protein [SAR202 cluster bacterium Casp-Chloro-G2]